MQVSDNCNLLLHPVDLEGWIHDKRPHDERHADYATEEKVKNSFNYTLEAQMALSYAAYAGFKVFFVGHNLGKLVEVDTDKRPYIIN